jgi:hypothetical protein
MLKFLHTASRVAGLTYQLAFTAVLIGGLAANVVKSVKGRKKKAG